MSHTKNTNRKSTKASVVKSKPQSKGGLVSYMNCLFCLIKRFCIKTIWRRIATVILAILLLITGSMYGIAEWYVTSNHDKPLNLGVTFISDYAEYLGTDPKDTLRAIIYDLGAKQLRLVSYWDSIEKTPGTYDFSNLDWQFKMAEQANVKISLAIGLRQPRWPECHMPPWAASETKDVWYPQLKQFMQKVIEHYRRSRALDSYQLENEFFLSIFGICPDFSRDRLVEEAAIVKKLDPTHKLIISRSNNALGFPINQPQPDEFGVSVYKRVWDKTISKRYFEYPLPAWFYGFLAGGGKILTGKDLRIHELQAEAWTPNGFEIKDAPVSELYKSMNPKRLHDRFAYAEGSGIKSIDLWGVEWWYQMKAKRGEPGLWEVGKQEFSRGNSGNKLPTSGTGL